MLNSRQNHQLQNGGTVGNYPAKIYRIADDRLSIEAEEHTFYSHFLDASKQQLNLSHGQDDSYIVGVVQSAISYFERVTSHYLRKQQRTTTFNGISRQVQVPAVPWVSLDKVEVNDEGTLKEVPTTQFFVEQGTLNVVTSKTDTDLPHGDTMKVTYTAGYNGPADIPHGPVHAIKMIVADLYEHRTSTPITGQTLEDAPFDADRLVAPFKVHTV